MTTDRHTLNKTALLPLRTAMYDFDPVPVNRELAALMSPDANIQLAYPFETLSGPGAFFETALIKLYRAMPDLERRDWIVMAGQASQDFSAPNPSGPKPPNPTPSDANWVGCAGTYTGRFLNSFLDIPPTGHQASVRFHEFYRFVDGRVVEVQALWDIPELMMQAGVWPMSPSLGREWAVPGPATQDGLNPGPHQGEKTANSVQLVSDMLTGLSRSACGVRAMGLEKYWHPHFSWYGPAGIGTARGIQGFRDWHQIPFLNAMPDRAVTKNGGSLFGDGAYVGFTAWPGMHMTLSGDGWLGIPPVHKPVTMRSLDFWRCENGLIRENWVLIDLLHVYAQLGVDVFARMRALTRMPAV